MKAACESEWKCQEERGGGAGREWERRWPVGAGKTRKHHFPWNLWEEPSLPTFDFSFIRVISVISPLEL